MHQSKKKVDNNHCVMYKRPRCDGESRAATLMGL